MQTRVVPRCCDEKSARQMENVFSGTSPRQQLLGKERQNPTVDSGEENSRHDDTEITSCVLCDARQQIKHQAG